MSFILDALKKSESERQRQTVPGLMDTRVSQRRNRLPVWAIAVSVLLVINLLVLTIVLWRKSAPAAQSLRPAAASSPLNAQTPAPAADHFSPLDAAPVYAPEIPVAGADGPAARQPPTGRASTGAATAGRAVHSEHHSDPLLTDEDAQADDQEVLPTISEISLTGAQALPELHLDVHVYATKPAERFVYINMRKYHQGATLQEGPTIERIRRDGVVLDYQGLRFILPRQP
jgi:general secretion pathway protein B